MTIRTLILAMGFGGVLIAWLAFRSIPPAAMASLGAQTSSVADVTVTARPYPNSMATDEWRIAVTLDTHSVELEMDLAALARLRFSDGAVVRPVRYEGDPPGGHHRSGVLVFPAAAASPGRFELTLRSIGNSEERIFVWP